MATEKEVTTRERIIQQSAELFNTYGYHACSLSHIMEATRLKKGGIYNHFKNKDEIAVEAFNYNYNRVLKRFRDRLDKDRTSLEKLFSVIDVFVSLIDDPMVKGGGCPIFNTAVDATNTHPELKKKAQEGIKGMKKYVEIKLEEGVKAGEFKPEINIKETTTIIIATLEGAIIMSRVNDSKECVDLASRYLKGYIKEKILQSSLNSEFGRTTPGSSLERRGKEHISPPKAGGVGGGNLHNRNYTKQKGHNLQNNLTAEATLWEYLKEKQLDGRKFRRQYSIGNYIIDFYCPGEKLAIELEGEGHFHAAGDKSDRLRDEYLEQVGIKVLRFENIKVLKAVDSVLEEIRGSFNHF